ncbi:DUF6875 domain-containing protein [Hyalangium minutum]|uniref:DUF6875 domain-containing protein n=1 Tax=Hyalangium minutum TaxID=394096 RepID=A0A085WKZ9_9BACT|nr:hypothetical protein [Hyalangium minutum]KFE68362.1 hypothetical protein DB31_7599 [Hyalangium minutum]
MYQALDVLNLEEGSRLEGASEEEMSYLRAVARWSRDYLTRPHAELGRPGPVCPWVEKSIQRRLYHLTVMDQPHLRVDEVEQAFHVMRRYFLEKEPVEHSLGQFKAIVTIFTGMPGEQEAEFMKALHERLKPAFVKEGLMLGEFYPACAKTGLRNPAWHPLRSSPPLLVIRTMVRPDVAFLYEDLGFLETYLRRFGQDGCNELKSFIERRHCRLAPEEVRRLQETLGRFQQP